MQLKLDVRFFQSALIPREKPVFSYESPYFPQLMIEGIESLLSVEFQELVASENEDGFEQVLGRTIYSDVDYSSLSEGVAFFIVEGGNMVGKGCVSDVRI